MPLNTQASVFSKMLISSKYVGQQQLLDLRERNNHFGEKLINSF